VSDEWFDKHRAPCFAKRFSLSQTRQVSKNYLHLYSSYGYAWHTAASDFPKRAQHKEDHMAREDRHFMDEADIGSGEKTPGQHEVEQDVRSVHGTKRGEPLDGSHHHQVADEQRYTQNAQDTTGRVLQSGTHLARVAVARQADDTFEAQVYVRLTREPEIAETYIPAGSFATEAEAWDAAEDRARRALSEHEF